MMIFDTKSCVGCRTCEMACSFHHQRIFQPSISSIKITTVSGNSDFLVQLWNKDEDDHIGCDNCSGEAEQFCLKYCNPLMREELAKILEEFHKK